MCWWGCSIGQRLRITGTQPVARVGRTHHQEAARGEDASDVVEKRRRVEGVLDDVEGSDDVELAGRSVASRVLTSPQVMRVSHRPVVPGRSPPAKARSPPDRSRPRAQLRGRTPLPQPTSSSANVASVLTDDRQPAPHGRELQRACIDIVAIDAGLVLGVDERGHVLQSRLLGQEDDARLRIAKVDGRRPCGRTREALLPVSRADPRHGGRRLGSITS